MSNETASTLLSELSELVTLVRSLKAELESMKNGEHALWDIQDVARYFKVQESSAYKIVAREDFPDPVSATGVRSHPRWLAGQVREFAVDSIVPRQRSANKPVRVVRKAGRPRTGASI